MKFLSRVIWSEGMHLGPHHFQTQSRYFEDTSWFLNSNLRQEPWGFLHFPLLTEALRNGLAILSFASGILPDGLIFDFPDCDLAGGAQVRYGAMQRVLPGDLGDATFDLTVIMENQA